MKVLGGILVVVGILMLVFQGFNFTKKEKVADIGPLEINKEENKSVDWPMYAGGIVLVAGVVILVAGNKKGA